jgi:hypothetical protein
VTRATAVLVLGLGAAFAFALAAFIQQSASRRLSGHPGTRLAGEGLPGAVSLFGRLLHSRR